MAGSIGRGSVWNLSFLVEQKNFEKSGLVFEKEIQNKNKNNLGLGKKSGPRPKDDGFKDMTDAWRDDF